MGQYPLAFLTLYLLSQWWNFFDNMGTLMGVLRKADLMSDEGHPQN